VVCATRFLAAQASETSIDRLAFESAGVCLDFCDDVTTGEVGRARALLKSLDGFKDGGPAAQAGVSDLGL
jgi:hypothetical protein